MPDVQYPDGLACLVHFIENAIDVLALTEKNTSDFPSRFLRFTSERTSIGYLLKRIQAIKQSSELFRPSGWRSIGHPSIDLVCVSFRSVSESDLVGHGCIATLSRILSAEWPVLPQRLPFHV